MDDSSGAPENRFQEAHGSPAERTRGKVRPDLHPWHREFIENAPFAVLSTADADGRCDASPRGGKPGFVKVIDAKRILLPDVAGNRLFHSYSNVDSNPHVALVFFIPGVGWTVRVNGRARVVERDELERLQGELSVYWTDDNTKLLQGLLIEVEQAYGHCPRALAFSKLWDADVILANVVEPPVEKKPPGV